MTRTPDPDATRDGSILDRNVETLLETGGDPPHIGADARRRIRAELIHRHAAALPARSLRAPLLAIGLGLAATVVAALLVTRLVGGAPTRPAPGTSGALADGSTWIPGPGGTVTPLGARRVRVEGAALLDVAAGHGTFVIETAHGRIEVLGTRFLVDASADRTTAAVVRGQVSLSTAGGQVLLHAGEQGVAERQAPPTRGPAPRLSHLVSWAAEARRTAEVDARPARTGSLFARSPAVRGDAFGPEVPLPLRRLAVDVVIEDQVARIALDQTFHNASDQVLEGVYRFAIPPDAALQRLAMYVDGKLTESAVVERMRARRIYEELVYRRVDPALLEWAGAGRLSLRVYPLPAHQDKRLVLAYTQSLTRLYGDYTLRVPMPEIDLPVGELALDITVRGCAGCELASPSHQIRVTKQGDDALVSYRATAATLGDSLVLHVRDPRNTPSVVTHTAGADRYLLVRAPIQLPAQARPYRPRTWVLLHDVSASRGAPERAAQAALIDAFTRELDEDDRLAVVAFDVTARTLLAPTRVLDVDRRALATALADEGEVGATDLGVGLAAALAHLRGVRPDDAMLVYLGDGVLTSGTTRLAALRAQITGAARFVGVGVGDGADPQALEALAASTGGYATTIDLADDLGWRAFDLVAALHTSRVTGLGVRLVDAAGALVPATAYLRTTQLAEGEELELVAQLAGAAAPVALELTGAIEGTPWQHRIALAAAPTGGARGGYLPRLWAQRHIAARLLAKHEPVIVPPCVDAARCPTEAHLREQRDEVIRQEVVALGKREFLLSRHTSLLVLENDAMYATYGVPKGAGDTWAPYALPATIPVVATRPTVITADVAADAELVRAPLEVFASTASTGWGTLGTAETGGTRGHGTGQGFGRSGIGLGGGGAAAGPTPSPEVSDASGAPRDELERQAVVETKGGDRRAAEADPSVGAGQPPALAQRRRVAAGELAGLLGAKGGGGLRSRSTRSWLPTGPLRLQRFTYAGDPAFDDLTAFVPALLPDAADAWRADLEVGEAPAGTRHPVEPAAATLLTSARRALPAGVYGWGALEIAVDAARRLGWRRTTDVGLTETAGFDGRVLTRRYAELGLDVTRTVGDDDVALALAYLPVWVAEPAHLARWFVVQRTGPREITLARPGRTAPTPVLVLAFDARDHLTSVRRADGVVLVAVTWGDVGPRSVTTDGQTQAVTFTAQVIGDAPAWAHGSAVAPDVTVELPVRLIAFRTAELARHAAGSPGWRHAQWQRLASLAAHGDRASQGALLDELRAHGGLRTGELTLASGGLAQVREPARRRAILAAVTTPGTPVAAYLAAVAAWRPTGSAAALAPPAGLADDGLAPALWRLRHAAALLGASPDAAIARLLALPARAPLLRTIGAALASPDHRVPVEALTRLWAQAAVGPLTNLARANAAQALAERGQAERAADAVAALVADLDLTAAPPTLGSLYYSVIGSRRGAAGWQLVWRTWRDRALAGDSFEHVMALLSVRAYQPIDAGPILARAAELAAGDRDRILAVAAAALDGGLPAVARTILAPLLAGAPGHDALVLTGRIALAEGRTGEALTALEAAQGTDEPVEIDVLRGELGELIGVARTLAVQSTGPVRADAVARALRWGRRWRTLDPANDVIDRQLGELLLATGDQPGAWRQLSTIIEREPLAGRGYAAVAELFEQQGQVEAALAYWQQAIVNDQTNPTHRLRKAQALIALGRTAEGDALLDEVARGRWHDMWSGVAYQARYLRERGAPRRPRW